MDWSNNKISTICSSKKLRKMSMQSSSCLINKSFKISKLRRKERMQNSNDELRRSLIRIDKKLQTSKQSTINKFQTSILKSNDFRKTLNQWRKSMLRLWIKSLMMLIKKFKILKRRINKILRRSLICPWNQRLIYSSLKTKIMILMLKSSSWREISRIKLSFFKDKSKRTRHFKKKLLRKLRRFEKTILRLVKEKRRFTN